MLNIMSRKHNYTQRLGVMALGILLTMQTSCTNHSQLEFGGDRKVSHTDELFKAITKKDESIAATYLFNQTNVDQYITLIKKIKEDDRPDQNKIATLIKVEAKIKASKLSKTEKNLALKEITKKDPDAVIPVESDESDLESNAEETDYEDGGDLESNARSIGTRSQSQIIGKYCKVSGIVASTRLDNKQKREELIKLLQEKKTSPKKLVEAVIEEIETCKRQEATDLYELLEDLQKAKLITPAMIEGQLFNMLSVNIGSGKRQLYRLLRWLDRDKIVTYRAMIEDTKCLEGTSRSCMLDQLKQAIMITLSLEGQDVNYTYSLLTELHVGEMSSLQEILDYIVDSRYISQENRKKMLQYIFEKSNYYQSFITDLPKSALKTLQWIIDNYFPEAQKQATFLKHVPEALKQQLDVVVPPAQERKSFSKKVSKKAQRAKSFIFRKKSTNKRGTEGSPKADTV